MPEQDETNDVSRETEPAAREVGKRVFADNHAVAQTYADLLADAGVVRGLIGPREIGRLWERHLLNCGVLGEIIPADADVLDIGSGAGLPGIPLAIARPDLWVTLVEPMERRVAFLAEAVDILKLPNVEILRARAESVSPKGKADVVTSRALAPLQKLADWCLPLARRGGEVLAIKGASAPEEVAKYLRANRRNSSHRPEVIECGTDLLDTPTTVIRLTR